MRINPYLKFNDGKCREAMDFYKACFGGKLEFMTIGESPMAKEVPAERQNYIMHSSLTSKDFIFFGSDMMRDKAVIGDNVGIALDCANEKELKELFSKLSEDGDVFMEPEESFWGGLFGMVTDKYGVEWMLNFQKKPMK
jgi:PhnB protein